MARLEHKIMWKPFFECSYLCLSVPNVDNVAAFISVTSFRFVGNQIESFLGRPGSWLLLHVAAVIRCIHAASNVRRKSLNRGDGARQVENVRIACIDVPKDFFFAPKTKLQKQQRQHGIDSSRLFLTSSVKVEKMSAGPEKTESCIRSGRARPHLFALWANTCQQLSVCSSRRAFLSANQCSFGRCVSKCHPKSNNCFLPFSFKSRVPVVTEPSIGNEIHRCFTRDEKWFQVFFRRFFGRLR